jgi:hypothetical protein
MKGRIIGVSGLIIAAAMLTLASACASSQVPNGATTQALAQASALTSAVASTIAVAAPAPWGPIVAGILGAVSVIAGILAHSTLSKSNAQQVVNAVTTGLQAASQTLNSGPGAAASPTAGK